MKNRKGEIATLLTLGLVLVGAVATLATSIFTNSKKNIASNPRAANTCYGPKTCPSGTTGAYYTKGSKFYTDSNCTNSPEWDEICKPNTGQGGGGGGGGDDISGGNLNENCFINNECASNDLICRNNKCVKKNSSGSSQETTVNNEDDSCCLIKCKNGKKSSTVYTQSLSAVDMPLSSCNGNNAYGGKLYLCANKDNYTCEENNIISNSSAEVPVNNGTGGQATGEDPYPQNEGRTPGMACCFKQGNRIRVYASADARERSQMDTPCTSAAYGNAYNADQWFECPDSTPSETTVDEYEASFAPAEETAEEENSQCQLATNKKNCKNIDETWVFDVSTKMCCPPGESATDGGSSTDPSAAECVATSVTCNQGKNTGKKIDFYKSNNIICSDSQNENKCYGTSQTSCNAYSWLSLLDKVCPAGTAAQTSNDCKDLPIATCVDWCGKNKWPYSNKKTYYVGKYEMDINECTVISSVYNYCDCSTRKKDGLVTSDMVTKGQNAQGDDVKLYNCKVVGKSTIKQQATDMCSYCGSGWNYYDKPYCVMTKISTDNFQTSCCINSL